MIQSIMGRLALRIEGDLWVAYYALPNTMKDALFLGSIQTRFVEDKERRDIFMGLMQQAVSDLIEDEVGVRPDWPNPPRQAPEHERGKGGRP